MSGAQEAALAAQKQDIRSRWLLSAPALLIIFFAAVGPLLAQLPEREQRILKLRFFHDMTQTEIAALTGISQMHVSRLLARTIGTLRTRLAEA